MKKILSFLTMVALLLSFCGCSNIESGASLPPQTTSSASNSTQPQTSSNTPTTVTNTLITVGNLKFDSKNCVSVEEVQDNAFLVTLDTAGVYVTLVAYDVSRIDESSVKSFLSTLRSSLIEEDESRYGETTTDISFAGFDVTHEYYMTIKEKSIITYHLDCTFTDSWYAYSFSYLCSANVTDLNNAGYLYGQFLATGSYVGKSPRFDFVQAETTESSSLSTEPPATQPPITQPPATQPPTAQPPATEPQISAGEKNALNSAKTYLSFMPFSYGGLVDQLEYEGYTTAEATYAADNCGADWNEQALKSAKNYLDYSAFSYIGLISQLEYEQYTTEQATYGVEHCGADWFEQAAKSAANYLSFMSFSRDGLIGQLEYEGFTHEQAVYGVEQNGL